MALYIEWLHESSISIKGATNRLANKICLNQPACDSCMLTCFSDYVNLNESNYPGMYNR